jgi:hypothetical protein
MHNEELHNLCRTPSIIRQIRSRIMKWVGHVSRTGEEVLVGKPEGKRRLGRPRRRWENGMRIDHGEIGWGVWSGFNWLRIGTSGGLLLMR